MCCVVDVCFAVVVAAWCGGGGGGITLTVWYRFYVKTTFHWLTELLQDLSKGSKIYECMEYRCLPWYSDNGIVANTRWQSWQETRNRHKEKERGWRVWQIQCDTMYQRYITTSQSSQTLFSQKPIQPQSHTAKMEMVIVSNGMNIRLIGFSLHYRRLIWH